MPQPQRPFQHAGLRLHYEIHGQGLPVLLLHGITVSFAGNFAPFGWIAALNARGLQVIGLDFPGHGGSDKPHDPSAYGTTALGQAVLALLDQLGLERVGLLGYSLGSIVALDLLHRQPARWAPSVLIATGDGLLGLPPHTPAQLMPRLAAALRRPEKPRDLPDHVAQYWRFAEKIGGDREAAAVCAGASYPPCRTDQAAQVQAPVLVISGAQDPVLGQGPRLAAALPQGRYLEIAGTDHFQLAGHPQAITAAAEFLAAGR